MENKIKISIIAIILGFSSCSIGTFSYFGMSYNGKSMGVLDWEYVRANPGLVSDSDLKAKNTKDLFVNLGLGVMIVGVLSTCYFIIKKEKSDIEDRKNVKI